MRIEGGELNDRRGDNRFEKIQKNICLKTILYLFIYPIIVGTILFVLGLVLDEFGFNGEHISMLSIFAGIFIFLNIIITWWAFYFGYRNTYKSTKFVIEGDKILFIRLKDRNAISGGTFYYHRIQSVSGYTITNEKITVNGNITKRKVDERYPNNEYKERIIDSFSVPNVFENVKLLEQALKNRKQGDIKS